MSSPEKPKPCIYCGADVAHQDRYKNRYGQYICPPCRESHRRWSSLRHWWSHHGKKKWRKWATYALAAALALAILWLFLKAALDMLTGLSD